MTRKVQLVVFDWTGTLIDYGCKAPVKAFKKAFNHFGLNPSNKTIRKYIGMDKYNHINNIKNELNTKNIYIPQTDEIYNIYENLQIQTINEYSKLITGVLTMQQKLNDRNIHIATTTGYSREMLENVLKNAKLQGFNSSFINVSPDMLEYKTTRESGDMMRYIYHFIEELQEPIHNGCVVKVGDTPIDMLEGKNSGAWNIGCISSGSLIGHDERHVKNIILNNKHNTDIATQNEYKNGIQQLTKNGANFIVHDINSVVDVIDNYINPLIETGFQPKKQEKPIVII